MRDIMFSPIPQIRMWSQAVLPQVYGDALSNIEQMQKLVAYVNNCITQINALGGQVSINVQDINALKTAVSELQQIVNDIANGKYMEGYIEALGKWIDENLQQLVSRIVKYVFFGLDDSGHFIAWIPASWDFIQFDTVMDYDSDLYGHLTLTW